ncbi:MAG TPA: glycogen/starch synthase, partial [Anaerolineaceae bacterium]|nr:glycogen/starch synthase [Anaerolineaceae bacterium]
MKPQAGASEGALRVLFLAAEAEPLIKVGGLGDVAGSLPKALNQLNPEGIQGRQLDVRVVLPLHPGIRKKCGDQLERIATVNVPHGLGVIPAHIDRIVFSDTPYYLVSGEPVPEEGPVYSLDAGEDGRKFTFTSLAALELARHLDWRPDILHANDWHTAMAVYALTNLYADDPFFKNTRSVLTVHNLPFLGVGAESALEEFGLPASQAEGLPEWARGMP